LFYTVRKLELGGSRSVISTPTVHIGDYNYLVVPLTKGYKGAIPDK